ncbi:hypothetical protein MRX96_030644 [Rhipicephalus microplus]
MATNDELRRRHHQSALGNAEGRGPLLITASILEPRRRALYVGAACLVLSLRSTCFPPTTLGARRILLIQDVALLAGAGRCVYVTLHPRDTSNAGKPASAATLPHEARIAARQRGRNLVLTSARNGWVCGWDSDLRFSSRHEGRLLTRARSMRLSRPVRRLL